MGRQRNPQFIAVAATLLGFGACNEGGGEGSGGAGSGDTVGGDTEGGATDGVATDGDPSGGDPDDVPPPPDPEDAVDEAKRELPTYLDLHQQVIQRTCTPDEGVCHNDKEYPDLRTPQSMLATVGSLCNLAIEDPMETFNGCELPGDRMVFRGRDNDAWGTEIAWAETIVDGSTTRVEIHLRDPIPEPMRDPGELESATFLRDYRDGSPELELTIIYNQLRYAQGETVVVLEAFEELSDNRQLAIEGLWAGDPNRDGVFGADTDTFTMVQPGDPERSYLFGRLQATVPGTPMPLANQPLSPAEVIALGCWIEGLDGAPEGDVYAAIEYDDCAFAAAFGQPQPDSGHSLSNDVQPIFERYCNAAGCHAAETPAAGLDLTAGNARDNLLRASLQDGETLLVVPGNPTNSYLMMKLWGKGVSGTRMPRSQTGEGDPLPDAEMRVLERWIAAGAPND